LGFYVSKPSPFFLSKEAQRRTYFAARNERPFGEFRACGRDLGTPPQDPATFLQKGRSKTLVRAYPKSIDFPLKSLTFFVIYDIMNYLFFLSKKV
jgi:hypothetical protein